MMKLWGKRVTYVIVTKFGKKNIYIYLLLLFISFSVKEGLIVPDLLNLWVSHISFFFLLTKFLSSYYYLMLLINIIHLYPIIFMIRIIDLMV